MVSVGAVRAGKAKDVVFQEINAPEYEIGLKVTYQEFHFPGGTPGEFVAALEKHFGVDWSVAQIPPEMRNVRVPEFRIGDETHLINRDTEGRDVDSGEAARLTNVGRVVSLYNAIAAKYPAIGKWNAVNADGTRDEDYYRPSIILLSPPAAGNESEKAPSMKVKALPLEGIPENQWSSVKRGIEMAQSTANEDLRNANPPGELVDGKVSIQAESKTLVVVGTQAYIDLAESVVAADYKNEAVEHPAPRPAPSPVAPTVKP